MPDADRAVLATRRTYQISAGLLVAAAVMTTLGPRTSIVTTTVPEWLVFSGLVGAFLFGEQLLMNVEFRRQAHSLTLAGIPLVVGLLVAPMPDLVSARLIGAGAALVLQRISLEKISYNSCAYAFEAALDATLIHLLVGTRTHLDLAAVAVLTIVIVVCDQLMSSLVLVVIRLHGGQMTRAEIRDVLVPALVLAVVATAVSVGGLLLAEAGAVGVAVVAVFTLVAVLLYRGYLNTTRRHQRLELMHEFVNAGIGNESLTEVVQHLLTEVRALLRASTAELVLVHDDASSGPSADVAPRDATMPGRTRHHITCFVDDETSGHSSAETDVVMDWAAIRAIEQGEALVASRSSKDRTVKQWLRRHDYRDAILVPLPPSSGFIGTLTVINRLGETTSFTDDDRTLLQTLTGHLVVAAGNARSIERLGYEATHDTLTGLANRAHLTRQIEHHSLDTQSTNCVLLLDLDRFKEVNDGLGHSAGDRLLCIVAERLRSFLPPPATVARLGGDEFAILVPHFDGGAKAAAALGKTLAADLERPVTFDDALLTPDASIGIALSSPDRPGDDLLRQADTAMYAAKSADSTVAIYEPDMDRGRVENLALLADMRIALREHPEQMAVYFQPKVDLATRNVVSAEALVRWNHPTRGTIGPNDFIPLAETTGLIDQFTPLVLNAALSECRRWHDQGHPISVAINLSARNLGDPSLPGQVSRALAAANLPPEILILEITESSIIADPQQTLQVLHHLARLGVCISLDDFGTGYSSLSYLQRLPVQEVKIDRSFVLGLSSADPSHARALISSIAGLGRNLGLRVVAEGVETHTVMTELEQLGCDVAQGYVLSRPVPPDEFRTWLQQQHPSNHERGGDPSDETRAAAGPTPRLIAVQ